MNPLELYQKILNQRLNTLEDDQVEAWIRQYPYFPLPYFLKARQSKDKVDLFKASLYATNRFLLKRFMDGSIILQEQNFGEVVAEHIRKSTRPFSLGENDTFSVVDFDSIHPDEETQNIPFCHIVEKPTYVDNFLNWEVKVRTLKYLYLVEEVNQQIQKYTSSRGTGSTTHTKSVNGESTHTTTAKQALLDQFLNEVPKLKNNLGREIPTMDQGVLASLEEDEEMVSETLAHLHLMQQNYGEAIRIYEKLSLLFPEKKAYFANQIHMIKNA
ncbi:MAG: hypothetical protein AAF694_00195 [Bacteroidota bacterium]